MLRSCDPGHQSHRLTTKENGQPAGMASPKGTLTVCAHLFDKGAEAATATIQAPLTGINLMVANPVAVSGSRTGASLLSA
jgi:hypothetical protein